MFYGVPILFTNIYYFIATISYFVEVARTGNISRAAESIGITQPSLSKAMNRLESSIGCSLLVRGRKGVRLTKAGKEFLGQGKSFLSQWQQLCAEVQSLDSEIAGSYRVGCHPSVALFSLAHFLPELMNVHKNLKIELVHDISRKIMEKVISCELDFGIVVNPVRHPELVIHTLDNDTVGFWVSKDKSETPIIPQEQVLICDPELMQVQELLKQNAKNGIFFQRILPTSNLEVACELTRAGLGVSILPAKVATRLNPLDLVPVSDNYPVYHDSICLIYRGDSRKTRAQRAIVKAIKGEGVIEDPVVPEVSVDSTSVSG